MSDENTRQSSPLVEVQNLRVLVGDVATALQKQRDQLRPLGMGLPSGATQSLKTINEEFARLESRLTTERIELGQLRALVKTGALINSTLNLDEVLERAMDVVIRLTGAERGYIILKGDDGEALDFRIARDTTDKGANKANNDFQISHTILNDVLSSGEALLSDNAYKDPRMQDQISVAQFVLRSVLCVPLEAREKVLGAVYVDNRLRAGVFGESEKNLLTAFANQAAVAIENARLYARLQTTLAEITEMKDLMDNVFASIGSGVITTDPTDIVMTYNRAAEHILGRAEAEAIGKPLRDVLPKITADLDSYLQHVREHRQQQLIETEFDAHDGERIALNMKLSPLQDASQQTQGVAMVLDDLTDQREREEILHLTRRYLPPGMLENIQSFAQLELGGVRRDVTCIFVDVRPLHTLPRDMRPQQVMETLNRFLSVATDCIHEADGVIDKYMGNEIMVLFNSQLNPQDDHAVRAVEAALYLREAFVRLYHEMGIDPNPHFYRIGMHTGVATLGNVGSISRRDFTAIGDTINLSKRVEENTNMGQIIISDDTRLHIEEMLHGIPDEIILEELEPIQAKGRKQKTRVYEVFRA